MLPGMYRAALLVLLVGSSACKSAPKEQKAATAEPEQKIAVPKEGDAVKAPEGVGAAIGGADDPSKLSPATKERAKHAR